MFSAADHEFMASALRLAEGGLYTTTPNPRVGCVVVKDGKVAGEGWHERAGGAHAEVAALKAAGENARGATAYVTLEPCSHHGRTPPCVEALLAAGVARVVAAMEDPNPRVSGSGLNALQAAGIQVAHGLLENEARELNIGFVSRMTRGRPWVRLKIAASLDGRTALRNGVSQWITGPDARRDAHRLRARSCAMLTGSGTVAMDDPQLTVREVAVPRQPLRVLIDGRLITAPGARLLTEGRVLIVTASGDEAKAQSLRAQGAEVLNLAGPSGKVDLSRLMMELGRREINELTVEAGAQLNGALLEAGVVDELVVYLAPMLLGDTGRGMAALPEFTRMSQRTDLRIHDVRPVGQDWRVTARLV
jgi:diaminohydroxyphosphoribosylaminopyrimidine deaminase/5-amino-6-(5-phosphoribosylamino)uracil reductase